MPMRMYRGTAPVLARAHSGRIDYFLRTAPGNSGGPVWVREGDTLKLIGIHVSGYGMDGGGARRVDDWFRREVERMIRALDERAAAR